MDAKITLVTSALELVTVAKRSGAGDTILLAPGNYGYVSFSSIRPLGTVTIRSADPDNDAIIETLKLTRSSNFVFADIDIVHPLAPGEPDFAKAATINLSDNISLVGIDFSGSMNGNHFDDGNGLGISGSSRITVLDSTFQQFNNALTLRGVSDVVIAGNTIRDVREGVHMAAVNGGLFERNFLTDIVGDDSKGDHNDAFQVQSAAGVASNDLVFRSNVIIADAQGIFVKSETAHAGVRHSNIVIENNYYEGMVRNAIVIGETDNFVVTGNTVREGQGVGLVPAIVLGGSSNGRIADNIAPLLLTRTASVNPDVEWSDNIDLWDTKQQRGTAIETVFADQDSADELDFSRFNVLEGSYADAAGIGFEAAADIGNLPASYLDSLAFYVPQFDANFSATYFV